MCAIEANVFDYFCTFKQCFRLFRASISYDLICKKSIKSGRYLRSLENSGSRRRKMATTNRTWISFRRISKDNVF